MEGEGDFSQRQLYIAQLDLPDRHDDAEGKENAEPFKHAGQNLGLKRRIQGI
jgi:hypothetical protein